MSRARDAGAVDVREANGRKKSGASLRGSSRRTARETRDRARKGSAAQTPDRPGPVSASRPRPAQVRIQVGDDVLVDTTPYGVPGYCWCRVTRIAPGSAAVFPIKVQIPSRGEGQYKAIEIADIRDLTPDELPL